MRNLAKCINCGKIISENHSFCMFCGVKQTPLKVKQTPLKVKQVEYINYFGGITLKRTTTTLVGVFAVVIALLIGGYLFMQNMNKNTIGTVSPVKTDENNSVIAPSTESEYVIKDSDKYPITQDKLKGFTKEKLAMARNEILARHGYVYKSEPYKSYFNSKSWYKPNANFKGKKADLSALERHNIKMIMAAEGTKPEANYDSDYNG